MRYDYVSERKFFDLKFHPFSLNINEGGRGVTLSFIPNFRFFRLYIAGWVFMIQRQRIIGVNGGAK